MLTLANCYGCTGLKLLVKSLMVDKVLDTSNAAKMLMLGDSLHGLLLDDAIDGCKRLDNECCSKWQLNKETFRNDGTKYHFAFTQLQMQSHCPNKIQRKFASIGTAKKNSWLKEYAFIGGKERPISQTI
jgi:hypothetical protein